jgi:hypothetical protein
MKLKMQRVLDALRASVSSKVFWFRVNKADAPDYYDIVKTPMELSTMWNKIKQGLYSNMASFTADFELMCNNCVLYNAKTSRVYQDMQQLQAIWDSCRSDQLDSAMHEANSTIQNSTPPTTAATTPPTAPTARCAF